MAEVQWGTLTVRFVGAEYEAAYLEAEHPHTFCALWLLEKVKWRRRKSQARGRGKGEEPLRPVWDEAWVFEDVRSDSKVAIDVWSKADDASGQDEFFGKVTVVLADALLSPISAWHELLPGRVQIELQWQPQLEDDLLGPSVALTLPPPPPGQSTDAQAPSSAAKSDGRPSMMLPSPASLPPPAAAASPLKVTPGHNRALSTLEAAARAYELDDEFDEFESEEEAPKPVPPPAASKPAPPPPPAKASYFEFTHRGGSGNGPKENQDAYFLTHIDDRNAVFGVLDGHGHDHGRIAAQAGAEACKAHLLANFGDLASDPDGVMLACFKAAHEAVFKAIREQGQGIFDDPDTPGVLVQDVDEDEWPLGFDAADGGTTCSVGALIDGRTLIYAAAGDSCALLGVPHREDGGGVRTIELVPEHSPTNVNDWEERLCKTGVHVVFDHPDMFDDQPASLIPVFTKNEAGAWHIADETLTRADELGCGLKTERGDRACVVMTPENGRFSQMMLGVTRSVGDFYHQRYGVTWQPEVVVTDIAEECAASGATAACLIIASDGVWDHWQFDESMAELCDLEGAAAGQPLTTRARVMEFFETTRAKGEEAFGDGADNLTGIVAILPGIAAPTTASPKRSLLAPPVPVERDIGSLGV